jgi:hypothetical protein
LFESTGSSTCSRRGLSSSNSSTTYPAIVPSENATVRPSSPSFSTLKMCMSSPMQREYLSAKLRQCPRLLTHAASAASIPAAPGGARRSSAIRIGRGFGDGLNDARHFAALGRPTEPVCESRCLFVSPTFGASSQPNTPASFRLVVRVQRVSDNDVKVVNACRCEERLTPQLARNPRLTNAGWRFSCSLLCELPERTRR